MLAATMRTPRWYVYKCVVDDGAAPCVDDGLLSLTICKPFIRSTAKKDDLIFAFGSNNEQPANRLVYVAKVTRRIPHGQYFELSEFHHRKDAIYERTTGGELRRRLDARVHLDADHRPRDLGTFPGYAKANALVCEDFRYFGRTGTDTWKRQAPRLTALVEALCRGHRANFTPQLADELTALKNSLWRQYQNKILGDPLHALNTITTDDDEAVSICNDRCQYHRASRHQRPLPRP
jgi:hypothetical protein